MLKADWIHFGHNFKMNSAPASLPTIRLMTEGDIPGYHACLDKVARERRYLSMVVAPPLEASKAWALSHIQAKHPFFVALLQDRVVGWCDITPNERAFFTHRGTLGMGVHPDHRGIGLGKALLLAALEHARSIGLEQVELEVFASNQTAIHLYERCGFVLEGTRRNACKSDGTYQDILLMACSLRS